VILPAACFTSVCCCLLLDCLLEPLGPFPKACKAICLSVKQQLCRSTPLKASYYSDCIAFFCLSAPTVLRIHPSILEVLARQILCYCSIFFNARGVGSKFESRNLTSGFCHVLGFLQAVFRFHAQSLASCLSASCGLSSCLLFDFYTRISTINEVLVIERFFACLYVLC
jgi:hypothetical protein